MSFQSMGSHGELLDVQALREQWAKDKRYRVAPDGMPMTLHLLLVAARTNVQTPEELQVCLSKISEILEAVWPIGSPQSVDFVPYGKAVIIVPKSIGE